MEFCLAPLFLAQLQWSIHLFVAGFSSVFWLGVSIFISCHDQVRRDYLCFFILFV